MLHILLPSALAEMVAEMVEVAQVTPQLGIL
jgi:hypothetical protein